MIHASDDKIIDMLNNGSVFFTRISKYDEKLPALEELYVHVSLRTGDLESTRDLYLKGQVVISDNRGKEPLGPYIPKLSLSPFINLNSPHEQIEQAAEASVPVLSSNVLLSAGALTNESSHVDATSHNAKQHQCISYNKDLKYSNFIQHTKRFHGDRLYKCLYCDKNFASVKSFKIHMRWTHKDLDCSYTSFTPNIDKAYECVCESTRDLYLKGQVVTSDNQEQGPLEQNIPPDSPSPLSLINKYSTCEKKKKRWSKKKKKERKQANEASVGVLPSNVLASVGTLTHGGRHLAQTFYNAKQHQCISCNKDLTYSKFLSHTMSFHGEGLYKCLCCDKRFASVKHFQLHMRLHYKKIECSYTSFTPSEYKTYECSVCDITFSHRRNYRKHLKRCKCERGTNTRPFTCNRCDRGFSKIVYLKYHICEPEGHKAIQNQMPLKRKKSKKMFCNNYNLEDHMNDHTMEETPICTQTPKKKQHIDSHSSTRLSHKKSPLGFKEHSRMPTSEYLIFDDGEYLCQPKIEVKAEDEKIWFTESKSNIHLKQEIDY